jgi:class 3 adenylate cyclase
MDDRVVNAALARLYLRTGRWYAAFYVAFVAIGATFLLVSTILVVVYAYLSIPFALGHVLTVGFAGIWTGIVATFSVVLRRAAPLWAWMGGRRDKGTAGAAWRFAIEAPDRLVRVGPPLVFLGVIPVMLSIAKIGHADIFSLTAFAIGNMCVLVLGILVAQVALDTMLRLLREGQFLSGEEVDVTIMFVDIVGFSARAEILPAEQVCGELNAFFELVVPVVEEHGGHTNKLIGDGLLAVFGTPVKLDDHADRAVLAACIVQEKLDERYRGTLRAGVGLHTGSVIVGTMGGGSKLDFTFIGDAVNVASRVEALTRKTGDAILITEATKDALRRPTAVLASRGTEVVKGRSEPVSLFAVASMIPA